MLAHNVVTLGYEEGSIFEDRVRAISLCMGKKRSMGDHRIKLNRKINSKFLEEIPSPREG